MLKTPPLDHSGTVAYACRTMMSAAGEKVFATDGVRTREHIVQKFTSREEKERDEAMCSVRTDYKPLQIKNETCLKDVSMIYCAARKTKNVTTMFVFFEISKKKNKLLRPPKESDEKGRRERTPSHRVTHNKGPRAVAKPVRVCVCVCVSTVS